MRSWGKIAVGLVITVAALWWALADVSFDELVENMLRGDLLLLTASVAVATLGFVIRAMRWAVFLEPVSQRTTFRARFSAVAIHFMANNVVPLRVGEVVRAWVFSRLAPVNASAAFGTVVVERFMDGVVLLVFLVLPVFLPGFPDVGALSGGWGGVLLRGAAIGVLVVLGALVVMAVAPGLFVRVARAVAPVLPERVRDPLLGSLESFLGSLASLRSPRLLLLGFAWTFGFWAYQASAFWLAMLAFGIDTGYVSALFVSSVVAFGVALPSAPGFFGVFHAAAIFALSDVYGVAEPQAAAFAFGFHFGGWVPITLIGFYYMWRLGLSLGDVSHVERVEGVVP